jgi:type I restriction enzyme S subunit
LKRNQDLIYEKYRTPNIPHVIKSFSKDYKIFVTKLEEQIKIGNFFKNIDDLITLHQRKFRFLINIDKI